jgi:hypothetical protein
VYPLITNAQVNAYKVYCSSPRLGDVPCSGNCFLQGILARDASRDGDGTSQESFVMGTGIAADVLPDLEWMLIRCYELRCWDGVGRPARERLEELGLWGLSRPADQASV